MSIYCTDAWIGDNDDHDDYQGPPPRAYQGSHIYPAAEHPEAHVCTAHIPHWCIPGHDQHGDGYTCSTCGADPHYGDGPVAPWLRLSIDGASVAMPRKAVAELCRSLGEWLAWTGET